MPVAATILAAHAPNGAASWLQDLIMANPSLSLSGVHALAGIKQETKDQYSIELVFHAINSFVSSSIRNCEALAEDCSDSRRRARGRVDVRHSHDSLFTDCSSRSHQNLADVLCPNSTRREKTEQEGYSHVRMIGDESVAL